MSFKPNQTSLKDFSTIKLLGKGSFSTVYLVQRKQDSKIYALKSVFLEKLTKKQQESSLNEVRILASIHHPNVISYKEAFWDDNTSTLNIVMEYADDGDLFSKIKKMKQEQTFFEEKKIWDWAIRLIQGLKSLHDKNIMHRDLKSENIFLFKKNSQCKIGDMNVSKVLKEKLLRTQTGTPYYASPEVWMNKPYSFKSDLWSMGCVIYEMCELKPPFGGKDMDDLFVNICLNKVKRIDERYSEDLWLMIKRLLEVNVDKRFNCEQFLESDVVRNKMKELKNNWDYKDINENDNDNSLLLNTIIFNDFKDIKKNLPNKKYYNEESTTESNSKKEKEKENNINKNNINNNENNINKNNLLIKQLRKELENVRLKQELRKKQKKLILNNNFEKNSIKQKIKQWDIKFKNVKIKKNLGVPNNYNYTRRNQMSDLSNINNSLENNKSSFNMNTNFVISKNKNKISYRNININKFIYKKYQHKSFTLNNNTKEIKQKNNSFSYNKDNSINNNNNISLNNNNIHNKLFNELKFLNSSLLVKTEENKNDDNIILKNKNMGNNSHANINFNYIPNNYQRYINNRYTKKIISKKTSNSSISLNKNRFNSFSKYLNNSKDSKIKLDIESNLKRIKSILKTNQNLKNSNKLFKSKSFSERSNKMGVINISKKKIVNKKSFLLNKIPKCNVASIKKNYLNIPYYLKQINTCNNDEQIIRIKNI